MLEMVFDARESLAAVDRLEAALARQMPRLLGDVGQLMVKRVEADFMVKARGGTGADGTVWKKVTPAEARRKQRIGKPLIGIRTEELASGFLYRTGGTTFWGKHLSPGETIIENIYQPKANAFNAERPIIPLNLPSPWYAQAEALAQAAVDIAAAAVLP